MKDILSNSLAKYYVPSCRTTTLRLANNGIITLTVSNTGVLYMHTSARANRAVSSTFLNEVLKPALEVDKGQVTDNLYIISKRFMASGEKPNADIINQVLGFQGDDKITEEHVKMFHDLYDNRIHIDSIPVSREIMKAKVRSRISTGNDAFGAYIFTHVPTGDQCVGSSQKVISRTKGHYSYNTTGSIANRIKVDGRESYTLDYVILPADYQNRNMSLALEQFLFFLLKPSINILLVANSTLKQYTEDEIVTMRKLTGKKVYMYHKGVLIHIFDSIAYCGLALTGSETSRVIKQALTKYNGVYYTDLQFSLVALDNKDTNLMSLAEAQSVFKTVQANNKVTRRLPSNTVPVYLEKDGVRVYHNSMEKAAVWLGEQLGRRIYSQSLNLAVKKPSQTYLGYKIVPSNKPLGYNNNYDNDT